MEVEPRRFAALKRLHQHTTSRPASSGLEQLFSTVQYQLLEHYQNNPPGWKLKLRSREKGVRMAAPDFCVMAPPAAGLASSANLVLQHPCVLMPLARDIPFLRVTGKPHLFFPTEEQRRAVIQQRGKALLGVYTNEVPNLAYPRYLKLWQPAAKIILLLRNPIERTYAHWLEDKARCEAGFVGNRSAQARLDDFSAIVRVEMEMARFAGLGFKSPGYKGPGYLQSSIYTAFVRQLLACFDASTVMIVCAEELSDQPADMMARVFGFLGLPDCTLREPRSFVSRHEAPSLPGSTRRLLGEFFEEHNRNLFSLIGRDLGWS